MRVPRSKIYRAFSELDAFDDDRCEAYVHTAKRTHLAMQIVSGVLVTLLVFPGSCLSASVMMLLAAAVSRGDFDRPWAFGLRALALTVGLAVPCICALVVRDYLLRRVIRQQLNTTSCPRCRYSLLGLRLTDDSVTCPECGDVIRLADIGLTPADVLAEPASAPIAENRK